MVGVGDLLSRQQLDDVVFHLPRRLPEGQTEAVRDAKNVRVDRKFRLGEGGGEDDARGLAADAG